MPAKRAPTVAAACETTNEHSEPSGTHRYVVPPKVMLLLPPPTAGGRVALHATGPAGGNVEVCSTSPKDVLAASSAVRATYPKFVIEAPVGANEAATGPSKT